MVGGIDAFDTHHDLGSNGSPGPATQPHNGVADSVLLRRLDKLATDLTTPRDSLTREVNLVVSLRTPPLITSPSRSHLLTHLRQVFAIRIYRFTNGARQLCTRKSVSGRH